uniref:Uncharacterized protein n=1 Tax=Strongyloides papillosus TaxID=174720 RepID=A0A0N5CC61_STREA
MKKIEKILRTELFNHDEQTTQEILNFLKKCEAVRKFEEDLEKEQEKLDSDFEDLHKILRLISSAPAFPHHHPMVNGEDEEENDDGRSAPPYDKEEEKKNSEKEDGENDEEEEKKTREEEINIIEEEKKSGKEEEKNTGEEEKNSRRRRNRGRPKKRVYPWLKYHDE